MSEAELPTASPQETELAVDASASNGVAVAVDAPAVVEAAPEVIPEPKPARKPKLAPRAPERPALVPATSIAIDDIEPDDEFQLREGGEPAGLATSLARVGQLFPIDVRPRGGSFQVVAGFRRLEALKFLQRGTVLARVHVGMTDSEAWIFALAQALESRGLSPAEIASVRARLERKGQLSTMARGLIDAALTVPGSDLEPEERNAGGTEEVDLDELAVDLLQRLNGISSDLSMMTELWSQLDAEPRAALLDQLRYYGELHAYLSRQR